MVALFLIFAGNNNSFSIEWIKIGNPGNTADDTGYGSVGYEYQISKHEVTNNQYIAFLNTVAASDLNALYNPSMSGTFGGITRSGTSGFYTYALKNGDANWGNKPVIYVSWYDALRFTNWIHNGGLSSSDTEDGAYDMSLGSSVVRKSGALVYLPTEAEWYKAAYYDGSSSTYYNYATGTDILPNNNAPGSDTGNSVNVFYNSYAVGTPYYSTDVGAYTLSSSPYGTFDQNGNVWEWNETQIGLDRGIRGGSFDSNAFMKATNRGDFNPTTESLGTGFRLAAPTPIPEPTAIFLFGVGVLFELIRKKVRK